MATKDKVLEILTQNNEAPVSGEKLAEICGVSRAAIWKAINSLREQNCQIEGTTNGGYVLHGAADILTAELLQTQLDHDFPALAGSHLECFAQIDSTNTYAKSLLSKAGNLRNPDGTLTQAGKLYHNSIYVAESQTAGKGRLGRSFVSPAKTGIYLSVIYAPEGGIKNPAALTAFSAVAVCRVIKKLYKIEPKIKWINDIYINNKKICGILTEGSANFETGMIESAVIGIGVNIQDNQEVFNAAQVAGSIVGNASTTITRYQLAASIGGQTLSIFNEPEEELIKEYKSLSFTVGQTLTVHPVIGNNQKDFTAKAIDIDNNCSLVVQKEDGTILTLNSGEVSLHQE